MTNIMPITWINDESLSYFKTGISSSSKVLILGSIPFLEVIEECDIDSSSDASIKNVKPTDIKWLLDNSNIEYIVLLGKKAYDLYNKYTLKTTGISGIYLNSPSSANASVSLNDLVKEYKIIKELSEK